MNEGMNKRLRVNLSKKQLLLGVLCFVLALGLGYGWYYWHGIQEAATAPKAGLNTNLPGAKLAKTDPLDKLAYYEQAKRDSVAVDTAKLGYEAGQLGFRQGEAQSRKIEAKIQELNKVIAAPVAAMQVGGAGLGAGTRNKDLPISKDVDRLELLMKGMSSGKAADPEMEQLGSMMDKLLVLQNPALAGKVLGVGGGVMGDHVEVPDSVFKAFRAEVFGRQRVKQGSVVQMRLLDTIEVSGQMVPAGHLIYALAGFSNQRLNLEIKNIRLGSSIVPVNLTVFDLRDGMAGINAPEALVREAVSGGVTSASGSLGITGFDLGTQLAGAGIDAARSLLNKKVSRLSQRLVPGYPLLLRDNTRRLKANALRP